MPTARSNLEALADWLAATAKKIFLEDGEHGTTAHIWVKGYPLFVGVTGSEDSKDALGTLTGMYMSVDEDLPESTRARKEWGELPPHSAILLEDGDYRDLDFVIWHHLDLVPADTARPPERVPHGQPEERAAVAVDPRSHASPVASHARLPSRTRSWSASH